MNGIVDRSVLDAVILRQITHITRQCDVVILYLFNASAIRPFRYIMGNQHDVTNGTRDGVNVRLKRYRAELVFVAGQLIFAFPERLLIVGDAVHGQLCRFCIAVSIVRVAINGNYVALIICGRIGIGNFHTVRPVGYL